MRYVYLHGFASGATSTKARFFADRMRERGIDLLVPDLAASDFENLTITGQLSVIDQTVSGERTVLIGSSMGGYLAALYASTHPIIEKLVLLAPAFYFTQRWPDDLGAERANAWRSTGYMEVFHYGEGANRRLSYRLIEDAARYPAEPSFQQPALIFHGTADDVVPVAYSVTFAAARPNVTLTQLDSDHQLTSVLPQIWEACWQFLLGA